MVISKRTLNVLLPMLSNMSLSSPPVGKGLCGGMGDVVRVLSARVAKSRGIGGRTLVTDVLSFSLFPADHINFSDAGRS